MLAFVVLIALLLFTPSVGKIAQLSQGIGVERLGQFGDAFGPLTCTFAMIAAVGAWASYNSQREHMIAEQERTAASRLDVLFFEGLARYREVISRLETPQRSAAQFFLDIRSAC